MRVFDLKKIWGVIWPYLIFIAVTTIMIFYQLKAGVFTSGADTFFHSARFYDAAMQIKNHNFSPFQSNYGFQQSGRVINALYGPAFAYLNGLILLITKTWFNYQIFTDYFICLLGAGTMMYLLQYVKINKPLSVLLSILYINIGMIPSYLNSHTFNGWGQAWMPLVLLCGVRMIKDKKKPINWIQLMVVMSVIIQVHILSTLMAIALLIPFFIICLYINKNNKKIWIDLFKAILGTICLTANVWGAYITLYSSNKLATPDAYDLRMGGVQLGGYKRYLGTYGTVSGHILPIILFLIILQLIFIIRNFKQNLVNTTVTIYGLFILAIASVYFPWGVVQRIFPFTESLFQFPYRLTVIAYPLLILGIGLTIQLNFVQVNWKKYVSFIFVGLALIESIVSTIRTTHYFSSYDTVSAAVQRVSKDTDLSKIFKNKVYGRQSDYLSVSKNYVPGKMNNLYRKKVIEKQKHYKHFVDHNRLILTWNAKSNKRVTLPLVMYSQSELIVNGKHFNGKKNSVGSPIVLQRKGINNAILSFKVPTYFYVLLWVTIISWIILLVFCLYKVGLKFTK